MLDQMVQASNLSGRSRPLDQYRWRPFQLAFLLCVLESAVEEDSEFRDVVDLIWFPTGGGKTEAYLALIAFQVALRRIVYPTSGGGTTVIMRYTLRLLTADQFRRACRLICAMELIRRDSPFLGAQPISVGMWVGADTTPNTIEKAITVKDKAMKLGDAVPSDLVLTECPWCGTPFKASLNLITSAASFHFHCRSNECPFGQDERPLPCNVIDESLFNEPPTLLIATVDKFARTAWDERTGAFFGHAGTRPPEIIIQDELHLISGALGSVVGVYEAALDTVIQRKGLRPKYIASTATIRSAGVQIKRLYGRDYAVFPPPGLSSDDSYFAKTIPLEEAPGRLYVGYFSPMLPRAKSIAPLAAAALAAPTHTPFSHSPSDPAETDEWWTQLIYHGSLKGVGSTHNSFNGEVRNRLERYQLEHALRNGSAENSEASESYQVPQREMQEIVQLTSNASAEQNAATFRRLERIRGEAGCIDVALATNMISVGLDVERLAVMIINGQPHTTAEYIQASSRVGRGRVPGIVFTNYFRDQARSLSFYENFRPYHESFYRFVEPTSVTPFTFQARTRALHAAMVIAIRHGSIELSANESAARFDMTNESVAKTVETLQHRCAIADPERAEFTASHLQRLVGEWHQKATECRREKRSLCYQASPKDVSVDRLLFNHGDPIRGLWPTLQSMRNVEANGLLKII